MAVSGDRTRILWPLALLALAGCSLIPSGGTMPEVPVPLDCTPIAVKGGGGSPGPEDVAVDPAGRFAFVSSADRWAAKGRQEPAAHDGRIGHLYRLDLTRDPPELVDVTPEPFKSEQFDPHGISLHGTGADQRLFVINHRPLDGGAAHSVEVFRVTADGGLIRDGASIVGEDGMPYPNDLVATGPRSFYVANTAGSTSTAGQFLNAVIGPAGFVAHYDGAAFTRVTGDIPMANGIALSPDGDRLYVASTGDGLLRRYRVDPADPKRLEPLPPLETGTRLDNIATDGADLLVAAHPSSLEFLLHGMLARPTAPTLILRIGGAAGEAPRITEALASGEIPAASAAAPLRDPRDGGNALLVGNVFSANAHLCRVPSPGS